MYLLIIFLPLLGSSVAGFFGRFLGSEGRAIMLTGINIIILGILLLGLIFLFRLCGLKRRSGYRVFCFLSLSLLSSLFCSCARIYLVSHIGFGFDVFTVLMGTCAVSGSGGEVNTSGGEIIPSNGGPSNSRTEDSFDIDVLLESWPTSMESGDSSATINQPEPRRVPPAAHVAPRGDEAGPSNQPPQGQGVPYPYHPEELIGGDSVSSIQRRLLASNPLPSAEEIYFARIQAEDLFEVKVKIIRQMEGLDPTGDWMRQGARALDSPNSATGESSLERLYSLSDDLDQKGRTSRAFLELSEKVALRKGDLDEGSSA